MTSLQDGALNFNSSMRFDFNGGRISSDAGLLAIKSFGEALGIPKLLDAALPHAKVKTHSDASLAEQLIYSSIAGYHHDDDADSLRNDPVFTSILGKNALASQPTISRFLNGFTQEGLGRLNELLLEVLEKAYRLEGLEHIVLDIDTTYVQTHGKQEKSSYNVHYSTTGFNPLVVYNGLTGDLLKLELREGSTYCSKDVRAFLEPLIIWLRETFPDTKILIRGDSGFATPEIYELAEEYDAEYLIRLKQNAILMKLADDVSAEFSSLYANQHDKTCVLYDSFTYQAGSWDIARRVVVKVERKAGELFPRLGFIVTSLEADPQTVLKAYNLRGNMENFIKETKLDFGLDSLSHSSFAANCAKCLLKAFAYNLINLMKRLVLPKKYLKSRMTSIRSDLMKIGAKIVSSGRRVYFRLSSHCPHKNRFLETMRRISTLCFA